HPKPDGLAWVGATEERKGFDKELSEEARISLWTNGAKMIPELTGAELVLQTACLRPVTPDWMPILGAAPGWQNVFLNTGAGKKGILFGPAMGQATADIITKGESSIDVSKFCADRFEQIRVAD
ncbi:MAG: FAD-binding oxidoreductase, partial [Chloroflexota bacterium]|nr:FAD-binding oxidoreductase [Chloroflexota bacterium]